MTVANGQQARGVVIGGGGSGEADCSAHVPLFDYLPLLLGKSIRGHILDNQVPLECAPGRLLVPGRGRTRKSETKPRKKPEKRKRNARSIDHHTVPHAPKHIAQGITK